MRTSRRQLQSARPDWRWLGWSALALLAAAALRLNGLDWDAGIAAHPDERFLLTAAEGLRWPGQLDPYAAALGYAYGHLPLYVLALLSRLGGNVLPAARALVALTGVATVALAGGLARQTYGREVGGLTLACAGLAVMPVQQAHFYTVDTFAAFFALAALWNGVLLGERGRLRHALLAGVCIGLAAGSKVSMLLLALPAGAACALLVGRQRWQRGLQVAGAAFAAFAVTNPFALLSLPSSWRNLAAQAAIVRGAADVPFTRQFHGTWPILYPLEQQLRWGMEPLLGVLAGAGLIYGLWSAWRRPPRRAEWVLLAWAVPGLAFFAGLFARFPRYLLPVLPVLCIFAARIVMRAPILRPFPQHSYRSRRPPRWGPVVLALLLGDLLLRALALSGMYKAAHPWVEASRYLGATAPAGAIVAVEEWDQPLPVEPQGLHQRTLPVFDEDGPAKWAAMSETLAQADYVVVASQRGYGALARWPERYPQTARYYELLFRGGLGFEPLACFSRPPRLGQFLALVDAPAAGLSWQLPADCLPEALASWELGRLDESFTVYDHPVTVVFQRSGVGLTAPDLLARIGAGD